MNRTADSCRIPLEAQARKARLQAALAAMARSSPSLEPASLQELQGMMRGEVPWAPESLLARLEAEGLVEEAEESARQQLRTMGRPSVHEDLIRPLADLARRARERRAARWQLDTRRTRIRCGFRKHGSAVGFDDGEVLTLLQHAFRLEGMRLTLDLGKRPRPLLGPTLPLPAGVAGEAEWVDAILLREPGDSTDNLVARFNRRLPEGLDLTSWEPLPSYASELQELARYSHWTWRVPVDRMPQVRASIESFAGASEWPWHRKDGADGTTLDLKSILDGLSLEAACLSFRLRMGEFHALNPLKVLGALFDLEPGAIEGVTRTAVDLMPDPRLTQADRFQPKLKNMYEDAVLLAGGSNITLVDDDDDEPIRLG